MLARTAAWSLGLALLLPLLLGPSGPVLARALGEGRHVCVCPLDAEGHCRCPECWRLDVHGERAAGLASPAERDGNLPPSVRGMCGDPEAPPALASVDPGVSGVAAPASNPPPARLLGRVPPPAARPGPVADVPVPPPRAV